MIKIIHEDACRRMMAESRAEVVKTWENRGNLGKYIIRKWKDIAVDSTDECKLLLRTYGSATNATPMATIQDPKAAREVWAGVWNCGNVWHQSDDGGKTNSIFQVLFQGSFTLDFVITENSCAYQVHTAYYFEAPALVDPPAADSATGTTYSRGGVTLDPERGTYTFYIEKRHRLYQTTGAYTSSNSAASSSEETKHSGVKPGLTDDAGSPITLPTLTAGSRITLDEQRENDCTLTVQASKETSKDQIQQEQSVRADQTSAVTIHTQLEDASVPALPPAPAAGQRSTLKVEPTEFLQRNRTTAEVVTAIDQTQKVDEIRADQTSISVIHTQQADGSLPAEPPVPGDGQVKVLRIEPTEFKERNRTVEETRTAIDQTVTVADARADMSSVSTIHTQKSTGSLPTTPPVPAAGEQKTVRIEPTEFKNRARTTEDTRTAIDQTQSQAEIRADMTVAAVIHTQLPDGSLPVSPPVPAAGETKSLTISPTEFKERNKTVLETKTAIDQTITGSTERADETTAETIHTQASVAHTPPAATAGQVVDSNNQPTEYKDRNRTLLRIRTAVDQVQYVADARADVSSATVIHTQKDATSLPTNPPVPGDGQTKTLQIVPTEFKQRAKTVEETKTATDQTNTVSDVRANGSSTTTIHTQKDTASLPATPPVPAAGETRSVRIDLTEFKNRARTAEEVRTIVDQTISRGVVTAGETVAETTHTAAVAPGVIVPPVPGAGEVTEAVNKPTEFKDRVETTVRVRTAINQTISGSVERADETSAETINTQSVIPLIPPGATAGQIVESSTQPTEFKDRHRTRLNVRTAQDQTHTTEEERVDVSTTTTIHTQRAVGAAPLSPPVPAAGEVKSVQIAKTEFKDRIRTVEETRSAHDRIISGTVVREDETSLTTEHTQAPAARIPTAPSAGQIVEGLSTPTEFKDRHNTRETIRTAIDQTQTVAEARADQSTATVIHTQLAVGSAPTTPPTPGTGEVKTLQILPTEFKDRVKTVAETKTITDQTHTRSVVAASETVAETRHTAAAAPGIMVPPTPNAGEIVEATNAPTPFKDKVETVLRTRVAVNQTNSVAEIRADQTSAVAINTQVADSAVPATPPVPGDGEIKVLRIEPTEFKERNRTTAETRTAVDQTQTTRDIRADVTTAVVTHTQLATGSLPTNPPIPADGQSVNLRIEPTEFKNRNRTVAETRSAIDQVNVVAEARADQTSSTVIHTQADTAALPVNPPVPSAGELKMLRIDYNEFKNRARTAQETRTAIDQTQTTAEVRADVSIANTIHTQRAVGSIPTTPPVPGSGETKSVQLLPTEFKDRVKTVEETRTATDQTQYQAEVREDLTSATVIHTQLPNASVPVNPPVPSAGEMRLLTITPTEFKERNRTVAETRTAIDQTTTTKQVQESQTTDITVHSQKDTAALPATPPTVALGQIKSVVIKPTEFKSRAQTTETTTNAVEILKTFSYVSDNQTITTKVRINATDATLAADILALDAINTNQLPANRNQFGRWDYHLTIRASPIDSGIVLMAGELKKTEYMDWRGTAKAYIVWQYWTSNRNKAERFASGIGSGTVGAPGAARMGDITESACTPGYRVVPHNQGHTTFVHCQDPKKGAWYAVRVEEAYP